MREAVVLEKLSSKGRQEQKRDFASAIERKGKADNSALPFRIEKRNDLHL
jgi:hypothetical protein